MGSLWPSDDKVCVTVARSFYTELYQSGIQRLDDPDVALALHKAVKAISEDEEYGKGPLHWAQFVHYGT